MVLHAMVLLFVTIDHDGRRPGFPNAPVVMEQTLQQ